MSDKFSYFDFIVNIIPGALILGILALLSGSNKFILITSNVAIDTLLFLAISFTIGTLLHQLSNALIQPLVKLLFWHGKLYSEVYLIKEYGFCKEPMRSQILDIAENQFKFDKTTLAVLDTPSKPNSLVNRHDVSHQIYRRFDYYTMDNNLAKKGHIANTFYSLYRTITLATLILTILFSVSYIWQGSLIGQYAKGVLAFLCCLGSVLFLIRTRREGERYIQGVLFSVVKKS